MTKEEKIEIFVKSKHKNRIFEPEENRYGLWQTYIKDETKARNRREITSKDKTAFYQKLYDYYQEHEQEETGITLAELLPDWLEQKRTETTAESYIMRIETEWCRWYKEDEISTIPLPDITPKYLERWLVKLAKGDGDGIKKTAYYNATMIIRQMLEYAMNNGIIRYNPMANVKINTRKLLQQTRKKPDNEEVFTNDEIEQIKAFCYEELRTPDYHRRYKLAPAAVLFQLQTGLRVGELVCVRYSDISGDYIHIQRMYRKETKQVIPHTKTSAGDRYIFLTDEAKEIVKLCSNYNHKMGYIFSETESCIPSTSVQQIYEIICRDILKGAKRNSHKARKTYISALIDSNLNINTVRRIAGHTSETTTLKNYTYDRSIGKEQEEKISQATSYSSKNNKK